MHLDAQNVVMSHDSSPVSINGLAICQQAHTYLNGLNFLFGLTHEQPKTVAINRRVIAFQSSHCVENSWMEFLRTPAAQSMVMI
jgi:hypothetical protein